jgi:hypothetical protein
MAELVDALVSGTSIRKGVQVRVLFRAPNLKQAIACFFFIFCHSAESYTVRNIIFGAIWCFRDLVAKNIISVEIQLPL